MVRQIMVSSVYQQDGPGGLTIGGAAGENAEVGRQEGRAVGRAADRCGRQGVVGFGHVFDREPRPADAAEETTQGMDILASARFAKP
jgi:hypothetical protein